jgi:type IV pilus biogenesis protein CpaD/CtpE
MDMMRFSLLCVSLLCVTACSLTPETWVNSDRVEIHNDQFTDSFAVSDLNENTLRAIAGVYGRYGDGPMLIGLTSRNSKDAERITRTLKKYGVGDVRVDRQTPARGAKEMALISFPAIVAKAPQSCGMMPGADGITTLPDSGQGKGPYGFGCTVETMLARQVHKPKDLLGRSGFETNADGARAETIVSRRGYYDDKPNQPLEGEQSSGK